jgi:hypothetical protein
MVTTTTRIVQELEQEHSSSPNDNNDDNNNTVAISGGRILVKELLDEVLCSVRDVCPGLPLERGLLCQHRLPHLQCKSLSYQA